MGLKKRRRSYSRQYKLDVIQQSYHRENMKELADELGIRVDLIYRWRRSYEKDQEYSFPGQGVVPRSAEDTELERVRRELADVRMERDILKKAI